MKSLHNFSGIYVFRDPVDMRKSYDGLSALVQASFGERLFDGTLFVFRSKRSRALKMLYWNGSGYAIWMTRLEEEKFHWPKNIRGDSLELSAEQIEWMLNGFDITKMKPHKRLDYQAGA